MNENCGAAAHEIGTTSVHPAAFLAEPTCPPAFDVAGRYVSVNGVPKGGGIEVLSYPLVRAQVLHVGQGRLHGSNAYTAA